MEGKVMNENFEKNDREEVYANVVRAGKRTYFFDVKTTRKDDFYLIITESKKKFTSDGKIQYEKHKIFLYKEDFEKFELGLVDALDFMKTKLGQLEEMDEMAEPEEKKEYASLEFEDLVD